VKIRV
jgi:carbonic anhydrase